MVLGVSVGIWKQRELDPEAVEVDDEASSRPRHARRDASGKEDQTKVAASELVARYIADEGGLADGAVQTHAAS